jgi:hypothetical protein
MPIYFDKSTEVACVGVRTVTVRCEKCGCNYCYELARIGTGSALAPYYFGVGSATKLAYRYADRDLQTRLATEGELVPCPQCHWINDHLVRGYRLSRYRWASALAMGMAGCGTLVSLFAAWFIVLGPPADRRMLPYVLLIGPSVSISVALLMLGARSVLRRLIQPNGRYPQPPRLPPGSPTGITLPDAAGNVPPVKSALKPLADLSTWCVFQIGRDTFPLLCSECLCDTTLKHAYVIPAQVELPLPRCARCAARAAAAKRRVRFVGLALVVLSGIALWMLLPLAVEMLWIVVAAYVLVALATTAYFASAMAAPVSVRTDDASRGVLRLRFRNPQYGLLLSDRASPVHRVSA